MKEKLELLIAMKELADNKISKTHDHDIANQIIDSFRAAMRTEVFRNISEKNEFAVLIQSYKTSRDQGEIFYLEHLLSGIVTVFSHEAEEPEPTLQTAMLATWQPVRLELNN
jgi:hypothetical protein